MKLWEEWKRRAEIAENDNAALRAQNAMLLDDKRRAVEALDRIVTGIRDEVRKELGDLP